MPLLQSDTPYPHWEFSDPATGDLLRLVPERGGLVSGWRCSGREMLYLDLERFLDPAQSVRGGIPVLFPICGDLPGQLLPLPEGDFKLPQHGFARQQAWELEPLSDGQGVRLHLQANPETLRMYPFHFSLSLEVRLQPSALAIQAYVENRGDRPMPYSFGLHPYFNVSQLETARCIGLPPRCLNHLTMAETDTAEQLNRLAQGVDLLARPSGPVGLVDPQAGTSLELQLTPPFDLVVLWSDPPRPMVCLEPWSGPRQALISGDRKLELAPGERGLLQCRYRLGPLG